MRLLPPTTGRVRSSRWICNFCRGISGVSPLATTNEHNSQSAASLELRKSGPARTRFAPSPTGHLHLGSLRTALFNYLIAKATNGQFLLRIEDTDQKRTIPGAEERLFQDLEWAGIEWDEGPKRGGPYGPYHQSKRIQLYREYVQKLLRLGNAYRCFCSVERLYALAQHRSKLGLPPDYDRKCAHIPKEESDDRATNGEAHVVRLKAPEKYPDFNDIVYGLVHQRQDLTTKQRAQRSVHGSFDDPILFKSDGFPTYHLANVIDDHLMEISHVIRGSEWMSSTPKHLAIYEAFGWHAPAFAHVGLLLDKNGQKLSKRHGSLDISEFRDTKGVFPETLTNFVALLGWSHTKGDDVMSLQDLIRNASMKFTKGDTVVSFEKLWFLQRRHAARYASMPSPDDTKPNRDLTELATKPIIKLLDYKDTLYSGKYSLYRAIPEGLAREIYINSILRADAQNYTNPTEFVARNTYFFDAPTADALVSSVPTLKLRQMPVGSSDTVSPDLIYQLFSNLSAFPEKDWNTVQIKSGIKSIIDQGTLKSLLELKDTKTWEEGIDSAVRKSWNRLVHQYLRWAISAGRPGPDGAEIIKILGKKETIKRLETANEILHNGAENGGEQVP